MVKRLLSVTIVTCALLILAFPVEAARPRRRASSTATSYTRTPRTPYTRARLSRPTNSVSITFIGVQSQATSTYTLSYTSDGIPQGVVGSVDIVGSGRETRDIYFGTCSHGVCTPHTNIEDASLVIETTSGGAVYRKQYIIRI